MGLIYIDDLKPGMKLEHDLICPNGRFLLSSGSVLEEKHIRIARSWGITEAYVVGMDRETLNLEAQSAFSPEVVEPVDQYLSLIFKYADLSVPAMHEIHRIKRLMLCKLVEQKGVQALPKPSSVPEARLPKGFVKGAVTAESIVEKEVGLASFPDIYYKIKDVLSNPASSASHMADVVEKDTSLSAKLLKIVNSAFYSFPSRIDSIRRAITIIGTKELGTLAVGISAIEAFKGIPVELTNMKKFWRHSIACGVFARLLGTHIDEVSTERLFVSGLLHDIGRLVIFRTLPEESAYTLFLAHKLNKSLADIEYEVLGFDHSDVGALLLEKWKFPTQLVKNVKFHHGVKNVHIEASITSAADCMAVTFGSPVTSSFIAPSISKDVWDSLGISTSVIANVVTQSERQIEEIEDAFFG
ncbi:HDOD domain-containing protein [Seleniivibrio woodruffii]|uniref:Putative nucleotidyltransferase with HDIG domain n=1 Tax=Seleniivibrio woodruffii TaxID=1078050 RepID=A0A4R1KBE5_9BACT|nr:HDOD domain-containing protein [Seleniivibrio woodruffii]TCK61878.1 putative nucleotidyltransferase with HDIG domain [Seleniivibrio woodruffii]TVZ35007.1 putative nucleotidyltransferase with HDIG domain [Seleniivibrio woodruffii]